MGDGPGRFLEMSRLVSHYLQSPLQARLPAGVGADAEMTRRAENR